jgi:hypothetical protein
MESCDASIAFSSEMDTGSHEENAQPIQQPPGERWHGYSLTI